MLRDSVKADLRKTSDLRHPISIIVRSIPVMNKNAV
jgi:hypothetical protein